jgi:hypothetical protein
VERDEKFSGKREIRFSKRGGKFSSGKLVIRLCGDRS